MRLLFQVLFHRPDGFGDFAAFPDITAPTLPALSMPWVIGAGKVGSNDRLRHRSDGAGAEVTPTQTHAAKRTKPVYKKNFTDREHHSA
jgi:hypothetical protein